MTDSECVPAANRWYVNSLQGLPGYFPHSTSNLKQRLMGWPCCLQGVGSAVQKNTTSAKNPHNYATAGDSQAAVHVADTSSLIPSSQKLLHQGTPITGKFQEWSRTISRRENSAAKCFIHLKYFLCDVWNSTFSFFVCLFCVLFF